MRVLSAWMLLAGVLFAFGCGGASHASIKIGPMPPGATFTGVWFSPQYGEMHLLQNGSAVIGRYTKDERRGRIQGSVEGDVMRFEWTETRELIVGRPTKTRGHGYFRIVKDANEDTWKVLGQWGHDENETGGGEWNAVKSKTRKPSVTGAGAGTADESPPSESSGAEASDAELGDL